MLRFENVTKRFGDGTVALDRVTLRVEAGEFCVLLGPSGAGKSTLLRMVNGMASPTDGDVYFDGVRVEPRSLRAVQRRIGMVHQQFNLVGRSKVLTNVLMGTLATLPWWRAMLGLFPMRDRRRACLLLAQVGLQPQHLYRRAMHLSGGQQQRVAIARAFIAEPDVVLADEPVASLDPQISDDVLGLIREASRRTGATVLCSLHQVELARRFADRIVGMRDGRVIFDGQSEHLDERALRELYAHAPSDGDGPSPAGDDEPSDAPAQSRPTGNRVERRGRAAEVYA